MAKIGESHARAFFLSGQIFGATKALEMGLIHQIVSEETFSESVEKLIKEFLKAGPNAAREAKNLIHEVRDLTRNGNKEKVTDYTCETIAKIRIQDEGQEGMTSLLEKKTPSWVNKGS
jgi:methylglutaconyl-CoA hydratase